MRKKTLIDKALSAICIGAMIGSLILISTIQMDSTRSIKEVAKQCC